LLTLMAASAFAGRVSCAPVAAAPVFDAFPVVPPFPAAAFFVPPVPDSTAVFAGCLAAAVLDTLFAAGSATLALPVFTALAAGFADTFFAAGAADFFVADAGAVFRTDLPAGEAFPVVAVLLAALVVFAALDFLAGFVTLAFMAPFLNEPLDVLPWPMCPSAVNPVPRRFVPLRQPPSG
jgi:hypothetical protein